MGLFGIARKLLTPIIARRGFIFNGVWHIRINVWASFVCNYNSNDLKNKCEDVQEDDVDGCWGMRYIGCQGLTVLQGLGASLIDC